MSLDTAILEPRMTKIPPFTVELEGYEAVEGETAIHRNVKSRDKLTSSPEDGIATLFDVVTRSARKHGNRRAVGTRKLLKTYNETKKVKKVIDGHVEDVDKQWTYFELSGYSYMTFKEYETLVLQVGAGLRKLGLSTGDRIHMFASTSQNWLSIAHGAMSQSMPIVTAYDTLGEEGLRHSLVSTGPKAIFTEPHLLKMLIKTLNDAESIAFVIYNHTSDAPRVEDIDSLQNLGLTVISYEDLKRLGDFNPVDPIPPSSDDLCCIMYTSGSSGPPKGVPLKHRNVVAAIAGATSIVGDYLGPGDILLAYLPLAHIFEFVFENSCLYWGGTMGYGSPRTLSEANCRNCQGDIKELKPTLLVGIPAVWETVRKGVIANVNKGGIAVRAMFWTALCAKKFLMANGLPGSRILDYVVFNKVKEATGARLRFCMSGAAPISKETQEFISMAICPLINGYGMTETTAMGALCDPMAWTTNAHGDVPACIEIKLVDFPEAGYFSTNNPHPQGEIWIRGESVPDSYYQNEEETSKAFAPGGWFKTGDIGEWIENGHIKIIDRKKNLVKTLNGEYIALEKLESVYQSATVVANICVHASTNESTPVAIIVPAETALKNLAVSIGVQGHGIGDLAHDERVKSAVLKEMQAVGKRAGLVSMEIITGVILADEEWTPQNNLTTATSKLNRRAIIDKYSVEIKKAYGNKQV